MGWDVIGDVHGHAERLGALLGRLGYVERGGVFRHASRTAIFVGDLIDRGPGQLATLNLVRAMTEAGAARVVMGNHELNAIAWATEDIANPGEFLRPRGGDAGEKNRKQHAAFLTEVGPDSAAHRAWADWFMNLPLWIEAPGFRVVHACWSPRHVEVLRPRLAPGERLTPDLLDAAHRRGSPEYEAVEVLLKGPEVALPAGYQFTDKDEHIRHAIRIRWWDSSADTYAKAYLGPPDVEIPDLPIDAQFRLPEPDRPTFVGHYWFDPGARPAPAAAKVACVDYSAGRGGPLVAYRFDGEEVLVAENFVAV